MHISVVTWLYQIIWVYKGQELQHLRFGKHIKFCISFCYREGTKVFLEIAEFTASCFSNYPIFSKSALLYSSESAVTKVEWFNKQIKGYYTFLLSDRICFPFVLLILRKQSICCILMCH